MADGGGSSKTILIVLVVAIVAWLLLSKASNTVTRVNSSVKQTYTPTTAISAVATSVAPALGKFLGNVLSGSSSSSSSGSSGGGYDLSGSQGTNSGDIIGGQSGDGLAIPSFASDDTSDFTDA